MGALKPGEVFTIRVDDRMVDVRALSMDEECTVARICKSAVKKESEGGLDSWDVYEEVKKAMTMCVVDMGTLTAEIDTETGMEICMLTLTKARLSDEDKKKYESPHFSDTGDSAEAVLVTASST